METTSGTAVEEREAPAEPRPAVNGNGRPKKPKKKRLHRLAMEFQPDAVEIERRSVPGSARWTLYVVIAFIIAFVTWACIAEIDRIVVAEGKLVTSEPPVIVNSVSTTPIKEVKVKFGDIVVPGQVLAELDPTFSKADIEKVKQDLNAIQARIARLKAEWDGEPFDLRDVDREDLVKVEDPKWEPRDDAVWMREKALYDSRRAAYQANCEEMQLQVVKIQASMAKNDSMIDNYELRIERLTKDLERFREMVRQKLEEESELVRREDNILEAEIKIDEFTLQIDEYKAELDGIRKRREAYESDWERQILEAYVEADKERVTLEEQLTKAIRMIELSELRVPVGLDHKEYFVSEVAERTTDSVLREGEALFKLIPRDSQLEVEVQIPGKDLGHVQYNDTAKVKFNAFPYQKHEAATGYVSRISEDSMADQDKQQPRAPGQPAPSGFRARIGLDEGWRDQIVVDDPELKKFFPGMAATVEIKVGKRRVIDYFLYPLIRKMDSSIREP